MLQRMRLALFLAALALLSKLRTCTGRGCVCVCVCAAAENGGNFTGPQYNLFNAIWRCVVVPWRGGDLPHMTRAIDIFVTFSKTIKCAARPHMATTENRPEPKAESERESGQGVMMTGHNDHSEM